MSRSPLATWTVKDFVETTGSHSVLATFSFKKLCVDPLSINTTIGCDLTEAATRMVRGDDHPINACIETSNSSSLLPSLYASSSFSGELSWPWMSSS